MEEGKERKSLANAESLTGNFHSAVSSGRDSVENFKFVMINRNLTCQVHFSNSVFNSYHVIK